MGTQRTYDTPVLESRAGTTRHTGEQPTPNTGSEHRSVEVSLPRSRPAGLAVVGDFVESNDAIMDGEIFRPNLRIGKPAELLQSDETQRIRDFSATFASSPKKQRLDVSINKVRPFVAQKQRGFFNKKAIKPLDLNR